MDNKMEGLCGAPSGEGAVCAGPVPCARHPAEVKLRIQRKRRLWIIHMGPREAPTFTGIATTFDGMVQILQEVLA